MAKANELFIKIHIFKHTAWLRVDQILIYSDFVRWQFIWTRFRITKPSKSIFLSFWGLCLYVDPRVVNLPALRTVRNIIGNLRKSKNGEADRLVRKVCNGPTTLRKCGILFRTGVGAKASKENSKKWKRELSILQNNLWCELLLVFVSPKWNDCGLSGDARTVSRLTRECKTSRSTISSGIDCLRCIQVRIFLEIQQKRKECYDDFRRCF